MNRMLRNKFFGKVLIAVLIIGALILLQFYLSGKSNKKKEVNPIREEAYMIFSKEDNIYKLKPLEVEKNNTENFMSINIYNADKLQNKLEVKVYMDNKLIYSGFNKKDNLIVNYKMDKEKVSFWVEIDCKMDIKEDEQYYPQAVWYANTKP